MSNLRQAAQQALECIDWLRHHLTEHHECLHMDSTASGIPAWINKTETALRAALAEPEQKVWCDCGDSIEPDSGAKCGNCVAGDSAEPEQEPDTDCHAQGICQRSGYSIAPTPRRPLTDEDIEQLNRDLPLLHMQAVRGSVAVVFARAIERAHGIGEGQ